MKTINTKEIRNDLTGFLRQLKNGQTIQVLHRSKPLVTLTAKPSRSQFESADAGTPAAAKHSAAFIRSLPKRKSTLDPGKSFKELYDQTKTL